MIRLRQFFRNHKTFVLSIGFLVLFSFAISYASPLYTPGQTLDPLCIPGSANCTVSTNSYTFSNGLTNTSGTVTNNLLTGISGGQTIIGGTGVTDALSLIGTSGNGTSTAPAIKLNVGNNGGTSAFTILNNGNVGVGTTAPSDPLEVSGEIKAGNLNVTGTASSTRVATPTGLMATILYNQGQYSDNGYSYNYRVYAYKNVPAAAGGRVYSSSYTTLSSPVSDDFGFSGASFDEISLTWTAVPGADGYRVFINSNAPVGALSGGGPVQYDPGYVDGYDVTTNSLIDDGGGTVLFDPSLSTITPTSYSIFSNTNTINGVSSFIGSIGIGTSTPKTALDIEGDGSILAVGTDNLYDGGNSAPVPSLGSGTRLEWIPSVSAFRAGRAIGSRWDASNVGQGSVAFGDFNIASGSTSAAFGQSNTASGPGGFATGSSNTASGIESLAAGFGTTASGYFSTAFGSSTIADSWDSFAIGSGNVGGGTPNAFVATDPAFEIGNANNSANSDGFIVLKNGFTGINLGASHPLYPLQVKLTSGAVVARFQNNSGTCDISPTTSSLSCSSDMNLKDNINNIADNSAWSFNNNITFNNQDVLDKVLALNPVDYNWKTEANGAPKHPGFIAQEVQQVFPDLVSTDPTTNLLSLNYTGLIPYTIEAIKEMNLNITDIDDLTKTNSWRDSIMHWLGDSANGITNIFSSQVTTPTLCVGTNDDKTCITKTQLDALLQQSPGAQSSAIVPAPDQTPSDQSPEVTPPVVPDPTTATPDDSTPVVVPPVSTQTGQ